MDKEQLNDLYGSEHFIWGTAPNQLARDVLPYLRAVEGKQLHMIDLGGGQGRDSIFFAQQGIKVTCLDHSVNGLEKAKRLAGQNGVEVITVHADLNQWSPPADAGYDLVYSIGALQYIEPHLRQQKLNEWKARTVQGGIHCLFTFIQAEDLPAPPDWGTNEFFYANSEIIEYYLDWEILHTYEYRFPCDSSGIPHVHAARVLIARNNRLDQE